MKLGLSTESCSEKGELSRGADGADAIESVSETVRHGEREEVGASSQDSGGMLHRTYPPAPPCTPTQEAN